VRRLQYLNKPYSSLERRAAQWAAAASDRPTFLLPVFVELCVVPTLFAAFKRCDLYGLAEEEGRARLKAFLAPAAMPPKPAFPGTAKISSVHSPPLATSGFPGKAAPTDNSLYDVFLSYSHMDARWVESLATRLNAEHGFSVWLDRWRLVPGRNWQQELAKGLAQARCCAVCINNTTPIGWCRQELEQALNLLSVASVNCSASAR
jgi:TIR domain